MGAQGAQATHGTSEPIGAQETMFFIVYSYLGGSIEQLMAWMGLDTHLRTL